MKKIAKIDSMSARRISRIPLVFFAVLLAGAAGILSYTTYSFYRKMDKRISITTLYRLWDQGDFLAVFDTSSLILNEKPFSTDALAFQGYAAFYLALSHVDSLQSQTLLDTAINSMRKAKYTARKSVQAPLYYMLGKAYFFKNTISSYHYYSELVVRYLQAAKQAGYNADDIPEYLGLSYAALGMTNESIAAFTEALLVRESDVLLLAIAEQYFKNGQFDSAKPYLHRLNAECQDDFVLQKSRYMLGHIYINEENYQDALDEFQIILQKDENSADAHYGIGIVYENQGDFVRARAEWRRALQIQTNHQGALQKISDFRR